MAMKYTLLALADAIAHARYRYSHLLLSLRFIADHRKP
jgi:hypothetical protein